MKKKWWQSPLFLLLLPFFFVFHGYVENYYFMEFADCLSLWGIYTGGAIVVFGLARLFLRNTTKAALFATYILAVYFFFGALHDFLRKNDFFLHRYNLLLPALTVLTLLVAFFIRKRLSFHRLPVFLNALLLVYLLLDAATLIWKATGKKAGPPVDYSFMPVSVTRCDSCPRPDIYFILFDDYSNSKTLKEVYNYDNSDFDRFLMNEGFHIQLYSRSNYASTPISVASILNYSYLRDLKGITFRSYADMFDAIGQDRVVNFLYAQGYTVVNYSPFDLPGRPSGTDMPFIPTKARLISRRTLLNYLVRDLQTWIKTHLQGPIALASDRAAVVERENRWAFTQTIEESGKKTGDPRFVYAHLFLPHPPFLFDSLLHRRDPYDIATHIDEDHPGYYLNYLPYTNARAKDLITAIKRNTGGKAVIIFMSDHGFRYLGNGKNSQAYLFNNQNAVYYPDKDYHLLYDSISGVNQFRVVLNKLFGQDLPLLKDSSIYLMDKEFEP
jgi:hypothetical protein